MGGAAFRTLWLPETLARALTCFVLASAGVIAPGSLVAQGGADPLLKTDIIRLLPGQALTKDQIADLIQRNCLAFTPTERDLADFRRLGATTAIMEAIQTCVRAGSVLRAFPNLSRLFAVAGSDTRLTVRVQRVNNEPVSGVTLVLRGSGTLAGTGRDALATTDARGIASFAVPAGPRAGTYRLTITGVGRERVAASSPVDIQVTPAAPATAEVTPARVAVQRGTRQAVEVTIVVRDGFGNVVPGTSLQLVPLTPGTGIVRRDVTSDANGEARVPIESQLVLRDGRMAVQLGQAVLAQFDVHLAGLAASGGASGFAAGPVARVPAGGTVEDVVYEVRADDGTPIASQSVRFQGVNASVEPGEGVTDAGGKVVIRVRAGSETGSAAVIASTAVGSDTLVIVIGPATAAGVVLYDGGQPVEGPLVFVDREPRTFQARVVDAHGNQAGVSRVRITPADTRLLDVERVIADSEQAVFSLRARGPGESEVVVEASGVRKAFRVSLQLPPLRAWEVAFRGSFVPFDYTWQPTSTVQPGGALAVEIGRRFGSAALVGAGINAGLLSTQFAGVSLSTNLFQAYVLAEFAILPERHLTPVISVAGGGYRAKSDDIGRGIYHTWLYWSAGAGIDVVLSPAWVGLVRVAYQGFLDQGEGSIGASIPVSVGARLKF